eukprot:3311741-Rhodomonas_salina.5
MSEPDIVQRRMPGEMIPLVCHELALSRCASPSPDVCQYRTSPSKLATIQRSLPCSRGNDINVLLATCANPIRDKSHGYGVAGRFGRVPNLRQVDDKPPKHHKPPRVLHDESPSRTRAKPFLDPESPVCICCFTQRGSSRVPLHLFNLVFRHPHFSANFVQFSPVVTANWCVSPFSTPGSCFNCTTNPLHN